jgi:hypothetical protein
MIHKRVDTLYIEMSFRINVAKLSLQQLIHESSPINVLKVPGFNMRIGRLLKGTYLLVLFHKLTCDSTKISTILKAFY